MAVYLKQGAGCKGNIELAPLIFWSNAKFMQAMLLAAGLGTRLRPYSNILPKPLFPVLNQPLLHILLNMLQEAGCKKIIVNGHHLGEQIRQALPEQQDITFQYETDILGTGGGLRKTLPKLGAEPLLVMNGDIFHNIDLAELYEYHLKSDNKITLAMHDHTRFNSVAVHHDSVQTFHPTVASSHDLLAFTGVHVVDPAIIEMIPTDQFFHIIDLYEKLAAQGDGIGVFRVDGSVWRDIGTPEDYLELHGQLLSGSITQPLPIEVPARSWLVDKEARLGQDVQFEGWGCIGKAQIGMGAHLINCVVWDGAVIQEGGQLANSIVAPGL